MLKMTETKPSQKITYTEWITCIRSCQKFKKKLWYKSKVKEAGKNIGGAPMLFQLPFALGSLTLFNGFLSANVPGCQENQASDDTGN